MRFDRVMFELDHKINVQMDEYCLKHGHTKKFFLTKIITDYLRKYASEASKMKAIRTKNDRTPDDAA